MLINQILDLFYSQPLWQGLPKDQMKAYFESIIKDDQIVTIEKEGRIIAFMTYWKINREIRDLLLKMEQWQTIEFAKRGMYPHCKNGKHLYINLTVVDKDCRNQFLIFELMKKINEKNPQMLSVVYHRHTDGKSRLMKRRGE